MIDQKTKEILDEQRLIFGAQLKEYFDAIGGNTDEGNNMIADIMTNLKYPTLNGARVTQRQIDMEPLTPEHQDYIKLKSANDRMLTYYRELKRSKQIPSCRPPIEFPYPPETTIEALMYDFMDHLKKQV